jgi:choline kinase
VQLVILAAGHGRRFGGLKQLAPVGPNGEAIMDYTARSAERAGFDRIVLVVRDEIRDEVESHVRAAWPGTLPVSTVCQMPVAGTTPAVLSARGELDGSFGVANADDLYGETAIAALHGALLDLTAEVDADQATGAGAPARQTHAMVGYHLGRTILTDGAVTRGLCEIDERGFLVRIVEQSVRRRPDGGYEAAPLGPNRKSDPDARWEWRRSGEELVSMNLWGFQPSILDELAAAVESGREQTAGGAELLLPDLIGDLVASGRARVRAVATQARCIGITHPDDLDLVRREVAAELAASERTGA